MAMPLSWSLTRVPHQLEHGIWRTIPMGGDQKADTPHCQRLDDVNKMTHDSDGDRIDWRCGRKKRRGDRSAAGRRSDPTPGGI